MKLVFASNYYNHHQDPLCQALNHGTEEFHFIATTEMRQERRDLGYGLDEIPDYVCCAHKSEAEMAGCKKLIQEADALIAGAAPEELIASRIHSGKLTFRYTERILKKDISPLNHFLRRIILNLRNPRRKSVYLLCAGAYTAADYAGFGLFRNRAYRWGYFPETKYCESIDVLMSRKMPMSILWAGRFLDWKHPEHALLVAKMLKENGYSFTMNLIGTGVLEAELKRMIGDYGLNDCVHLLGAMKPAQVRQHMEQSEIFLFTSDRQEGWGAVLNESMNSGCAVVASHAIGAVPFLLENETNGLVYKSCDIDMLCEKVAFLLEHPEQRAALGRCAYETITTEWNAETAAERLCNLASHILAGEDAPELYKTGPCSRAPVISDDWM